MWMSSERLVTSNVGASTSRNPKGLHGLYKVIFTLYPRLIHSADLCHCYMEIRDNLLSLRFAFLVLLRFALLS
jgi:hypothetical protein